MLPEEKGEKNTADVTTGNTFDPRGNLQAFPGGHYTAIHTAKASQVKWQGVPVQGLS